MDQRREGYGARPLGRQPGRSIHQSKGSDELPDLSASAPASAQRFESSTFQRLSSGRILRGLLAANKQSDDPSRGALLPQVPQKHNEMAIVGIQRDARSSQRKTRNFPVQDSFLANPHPRVKSLKRLGGVDVTRDATRDATRGVRRSF